MYEKLGGGYKPDWLRGEGCQFCSGTGYQGRIGVYEVLRITNEMRDLIVHNAPVDEIRKLAVDQATLDKGKADAACASGRVASCDDTSKLKFPTVPALP